MNAKEYLRQSYKIKESIESEKESLQTLRDLSESITADMTSERVQCSKSNDKTASIVAKIVDKEEIINQRIDMINKLEDVNERTLLNLRYVNNNSWKEIAFKMNYSMRSVHYIHASALKNFEELLHVNA